MKAKSKLILSCILLMLTILLGVLALLSAQLPYQNTVIAIPKKDSSPSPSIEKLDNVKNLELITTYVTSRQSDVSVNSFTHKVNLISTNNYLGVVSENRLISGSFFTQSAYEDGSNQLVLNDQAAARFFGSNDIIGKEVEIEKKAYTVVGVIKDSTKDNFDQLNIYLPNTTFPLVSQVIIAKLEPKNGVDEIYAVDKLKKIGIHSSTYDFIFLGKIVASLQMNFLFVLLTILLYLQIICFAKTIEFVKKLYSEKTKELKQAYLGEVAKLGLKPFAKLITSLAYFIFFVWFLFFYLSKLLSIILNLSSTFPPISEYHRWNLQNLFLPVQRLTILSNITAALALLILSFLLFQLVRACLHKANFRKEATN